MTDTDESVCEVENTIELLGRKHMLRILKKFYESDSGIRFTEFSEDLNINSKTLSDRLYELEESGIIRKMIYSRPRREEYIMTDAGDQLSLLFDALKVFEFNYDKSIKAARKNYSNVISQ